MLHVLSQQEFLNVQKQSLHAAPELIDMKRNRLEQWSDATTLYRGSQILPHFSPCLPFDCLHGLSVALFVILQNTSQRAEKQILPRNLSAKTASPRVCFGFNDGHIREPGGSLLLLSPRASAPDYSLTSDSL